MENQSNINSDESNLISNRRGEVAVRTDSLIEARYQLSSRANDIVDMVTVELKDDNNLTYEISLNNYSHYVINNENVYRDFKKVVNAFKGQGVFVKDDNGSEAYYPWFSRIKYVEGKILVDLHQDMKNLLLSSKRGIYYDIKYSINLTNEYAKKYYYCCKLYATSNPDKKSGFRNDRIEDLQIKLEVPKSYRSRFSLFEKHVLEVAKQQINEFSDINIDYEIIKKGKRITNIYTKIWLKEQEQLQEINSKILNVKKEDNVLEKKDVSIRLQVLRLVKPYEDIIIKGLSGKNKSSESKKIITIKEMVAENLGMTIKNVNRYLYINYKLIIEFVEMFDKKFITLGQAEKFARLSTDEQKKELKKMKYSIDKMKHYLIDEMSELLNDYKISFNIAEKYSKQSEEEQMKYYKKYYNKLNIIDAEYSEVQEEVNNEIDIDYENIDSEIAIDYENIDSEIDLDITSDKINNELDDSTSIKEKAYNDIPVVKYIINSTLNIDIDDDIAGAFYNSAKAHKLYGNDPLKLIKEVAEYSLTQNIDRNLINWFQNTLKNFNRPLTQLKPKPKLKFDNFEGRNYDYDALEKKLLGWDEN